MKNVLLVLLGAAIAAILLAEKKKVPPKIIPKHGDNVIDFPKSTPK